MDISALQHISGDHGTRSCIRAHCSGVLAISDRSTFLLKEKLKSYRLQLMFYDLMNPCSIPYYFLFCFWYRFLNKGSTDRERKLWTKWGGLGWRRWKQVNQTLSFLVKLQTFWFGRLVLDMIRKFEKLQLSMTMLHGGNSSANRLNSAISEAIWIIFEISLNLQRKKNWVGEGVGRAANHCCGLKTIF